MTRRVLKMAMVGGGRDAFIGAIHRAAAGLDGQARLAAGALASTPDRALASGRDLGLADDRNYPDWRAMLAGEAARPRGDGPGDRADFVTIVTPNDTHHEIARAFIAAGFHTVLDKPMTTTVSQADDLSRAALAAGVLVLVTYTYAGYPMVRQARDLVLSGMVGAVRRVMVEYHQDWLAGPLERSGQKQAAWRTDPARTGRAGSIGDIGSHAEHLARFVTGLSPTSLCADLSSFVPGRAVDDDASVLLRYEGGARGVLTASQVCVGSDNALRLRVWGETGGVSWSHEEPDRLAFFPKGAAAQELRRGHAYLGDDARRAARLPAGHPEGFIEAFANLYAGFFAAIRDGAGPGGGEAYGFPDAEDGARGVRFIDRVLASAAAGASWVDTRPAPANAAGPGTSS